MLEQGRVHGCVAAWTMSRMQRSGEGKVAGQVAKYAGMSSAVPVVGEVAARVAAGAKAVQGAALGVQSGAKLAVKGTPLDLKRAIWAAESSSMINLWASMVWLIACH